ncbi:DUF3617 domain-containing protein [Methyloligella sp. GL2]|uniref:DUF3617 domain-containing protein n=1 Tax=Methyloligella sp. GL2 TaxID=2742204 RepID=UPI001ABA254C|nr:DUF3617 domain-containing protein [Methyloligella sp. GL2]
MIVATGASAQQVRPGLWQQDITMNMGGMGMPKMPQISDAQRKQMEAMGIKLPDFSKPSTISAKTCITQEMIDNQGALKPKDMEQCRVENRKVTGSSMAADLVCDGGQFQGNGHMEYVFDSDTHYSGQMKFTGQHGAGPIEMTHKVDATWVSDDCGNVR